MSSRKPGFTTFTSSDIRPKYSKSWRVLDEPSEAAIGDSPLYHPYNPRPTLRPRPFQRCDVRAGVPGESSVTLPEVTVQGAGSIPILSFPAEEIRTHVTSLERP